MVLFIMKLYKNNSHMLQEIHFIKLSEDRLFEKNDNFLSATTDSDIFQIRNQIYLLFIYN